MEMSREIIPVRRTTWVEANIVALKVKKNKNKKLLAQAVGHRRCSTNIRFPVQHPRT